MENITMLYFHHNSNSTFTTLNIYKLQILRLSISIIQSPKSDKGDIEGASKLGDIKKEYIKVDKLQRTGKNWILNLRM